LKFVPEIGKLYQFKTDNIDEILKKYSHRYTGLALCIQVDILEDISESQLPPTMKEYMRKNPIFGFETYNCKQYYKDSAIVPDGINVNSLLYLTYNEVNDMLEHANKK
jgi:hypothetical protein